MKKLNYVPGIEPKRKPYSLRLSKYHAIGDSVAEILASFPEEKRASIKMLDLGGDEGRILRYIEAYSGKEDIPCDIVDLFPKGTDRVYKKEQRKLFQADLENGLHFLEANSYDILICEQVLEHLRQPQIVLQEISRILKKDGFLLVGVPIFPPGLRWIRHYLVPLFDKITRRQNQRSHCQAFSKRSFLKLLNQTGHWEILENRGFRIVSGGLVRFLENYRWWWRVNRAIGALLPSLCVEIQIIARKKE